MFPYGTLSFTAVQSSTLRQPGGLVLPDGGTGKRQLSSLGKCVTDIVPVDA